MKSRRQLPFTLDLNDRNSLSAQMESALRQAIVSGRFRPGETLPTIREWAKMLGVSMRVPEAVIPRLVREGLIVARPRHGCIVAPRGASIFRGHVLLVVPPSDHIYLANVMNGRITRRLEDAGYLVSRSTFPCDGRGRPDLTRLNLALKQSVDLAVLVYEHPAAVRAAEAAKVPYVTFGDAPTRHAVGHVCISSRTAFDELAAECARRGVRKLEIVTKDYSTIADKQSFPVPAGIRVRVTPVAIDPNGTRPDCIVRGSLAAFQTRFRRKDPELPDLLCFTDDHLFRGALPVLLKNGICLPDDVAVVTFSNRGNAPVSPDPFDQIELDPLLCGDKVADGILAFFKTGRFPKLLELSARYVRG